jgi:hypothetical protein
LSVLAVDNQGTNAPRFLAVSVFYLCSFSVLALASVSSLFRLSLVCLSFFAPEMLGFVRFCPAMSRHHNTDNR